MRLLRDTVRKLSLYPVDEIIYLRRSEVLLDRALADKSSWNDKVNYHKKE